MKKKLMIRVLSFLLLVVMLAGTGPAAHAAGSYEKMTVTELMKMFDSSVQKPKKNTILDEPMTATVVSTYGNYIYVYTAPNGKKLYEAQDAATVIVYARQNGWALGIVENTRIGGWMPEGKLEYDDSASEVKQSGSAAKKENSSSASAGSSTSASSGGDVTELMKLFDSRVQKPKASSILDEPEVLEVWTKYGRLDYIYSRPAQGSTYKLGDVREGSVVTVYARQNGWSLCIVENTSLGGWMKSGALDEKTHEDHPSFLDIPDGLPKGTYTPVRGEYLDEYETMYVKSKYGVRIYIIDDPRKKEKDQEIIGYAYEAEECTVLARCSGQLFVVTENGKAGWVKAQLMVYDYD